MAEAGAHYDSLLLTYTQTIGVALRGAVAIIFNRHAFLDDEILPEPKLPMYLKTIEETIVKIDAILEEGSHLEMYREGFGDALRWVLTFGLDADVADEIKKALDG